MKRRVINADSRGRLDNINMVNNLSLEEFLERNRIDHGTWEKANINWTVLQSIAADHEAMSGNLENSAELFAKVIQKSKGVHSVRWRVKNPEHLLEKIVRKRAEGNQKYTDITLENYFEHVTDLIGVRALHLFKENCFEIDAAIRSVWTPIEKPVAYIRDGDSGSLKNRFEDAEFEVRNHPAGYRSVHYVIESVPLGRKVRAEIQVRTIFEEGWSEIDHKVRYPNFSDNELVGYFLAIFNRMAGSADDMGGFVLGLVATLGHLEDELIATRKEKDSTFKDMENALAQLESVKEQDRTSKENISKLKMEVARLKEVNQAGGLLSGTVFDTTLLGLGQAFSGVEAGIAEQARRGLLGPSLNDVLGVSAAEQIRRGLLSHNFSAVEQAKHGLPKKE